MRVRRGIALRGLPELYVRVWIPDSSLSIFKRTQFERKAKAIEEFKTRSSSGLVNKGALGNASEEMSSAVSCRSAWMKAPVGIIQASTEPGAIRPPKLGAVEEPDTALFITSKFMLGKLA